MPTLHRGHVIIEVGGIWLYADTREPVSEAPDRACGHCGLPNTAEGHDGCLGTLPGVMNACCGHGCPAEAYVQYPSGVIVSGPDALSTFTQAGYSIPDVRG